MKYVFCVIALHNNISEFIQGKFNNLIFKN